MSLALPFNLLADTAFFRLPGRVFFDSDIQRIHSSFKILKCVSGKSFLAKLLETNLSQKKKIEISELKESSEEVVEALLLPYIHLEKLKLVSVSRGKGKLSNVELARLGEKCRKLVWENLENEEKALLISEVFLRERFGKEDQKAKVLQEFKKSLNVKDKHEIFSLKISKKFLTPIKEPKKPKQDSGRK